MSNTFLNNTPEEMEAIVSAVVTDEDVKFVAVDTVNSNPDVQFVGVATGDIYFLDLATMQVKVHIGNGDFVGAGWVK